MTKSLNKISTTQEKHQSRHWDIGEILHFWEGFLTFNRESNLSKNKRDSQEQQISLNLISIKSTPMKSLLLRSSLIQPSKQPLLIGIPYDDVLSTPTVYIFPTNALHLFLYSFCLERGVSRHGKSITYFHSWTRKGGQRACHIRWNEIDPILTPTRLLNTNHQR